MSLLCAKLHMRHDFSEKNVDYHGVIVIEMKSVIKWK